jgi:secreted Zn-dependent insulinase-like peptidase
VPWHDTDIEPRLRDSHSFQRYTAVNMDLVLVGKQSLEELEKIAGELFSAVPGPALQKQLLQLEVKCDGSKDPPMLPTTESKTGSNKATALLSRQKKTVQ